MTLGSSARTRLGASPLSVAAGQISRLDDRRSRRLRRGAGLEGRRRHPRQTHAFARTRCQCLGSPFRAAELAYFGAGVLHPVAMQPGRNTPCASELVQSCRRWHALPADFTAKGWCRPSRASRTLSWSTSPPRACSARGFLSQVFESFKRRCISVDVVAIGGVRLAHAESEPSSRTSRSTGRRHNRGRGLRGVLQTSRAADGPQRASAPSSH